MINEEITVFVYLINENRPAEIGEVVIVNAELAASDNVVCVNIPQELAEIFEEHYEQDVQPVRELGLRDWLEPKDLLDLIQTVQFEFCGKGSSKHWSDWVVTGVICEDADYKIRCWSKEQERFKCENKISSFLVSICAAF